MSFGIGIAGMSMAGGMALGAIGAAEELHALTYVGITVIVLGTLIGLFIMWGEHYG